MKRRETDKQEYFKGQILVIKYNENELKMKKNTFAFEIIIDYESERRGTFTPFEH